MPRCGSAEPSFLRSLVNINKFRFTHLFMFTRSLENNMDKLKTLGNKYFSIPKDIKLFFPKEKNLSPSDIKKLAYIPWHVKYLNLCPKEYRLFFKKVLPHLNSRTTNVHTAVSLSYLDKLIKEVEKEKRTKIKRDIVAMGLILHDCGWSALTKKEIINSLSDYKELKIKGVALKPKLKHAKEGVKIAKKILNNYNSKPHLTQKEKEIILEAVFWHDKTEKLKNKKFPIEVKLIADLDHLWSYSYLNFWQDTIRKNINPQEYIKNLEKSIDYYFIFNSSKKMAKSLLTQRKKELKSNINKNQCLIFFNIERTWDIRWGHAVNNSKRLEKYCNSPNIMMIEGDIRKIKKHIVMLHDRDRKTDLTFDVWIKKIATSKKGAKLDFKDPRAVLPCLKKLQTLNFKNPIFLNADILRGPGGKIPKVEAIKFIKICQKYFPKSTLSIGWTTKDLPNKKYTKKMILEMLELIKNFNCEITFPIKASYLKSSYPNIELLLQNPNHTITIWGYKPISNSFKKWIKLKLNRNKTYHDLVDEQGNPMLL